MLTRIYFPISRFNAYKVNGMYVKPPYIKPIRLSPHHYGLSFQIQVKNDVGA